MENLVSGARKIAPDAGAKQRMIATAKLCVDTEGRVSDYVQMKSSGDPAFDDKLETTIRAWRFKPFVIAGKPTAVCSAHTTVVQPR
jgi:TonB family protein